MKAWLTVCGVLTSCYGSWLCSVIFSQLFLFAFWTWRPPSSSVSVNYPWFSLCLHTTTTPITATKHTNPHFYNCSRSSAVIPLWPGASRWVAATQVARGSAAPTFAGSHYGFWPRLCLITRTFLKLIFPNCRDSCSNLSISLIPSSFLLHPFGKRRDHVGQVVAVFQGQSWHNQLKEGTMIWQIKGTADYN